MKTKPTQTTLKQFKSLCQQAASLKPLGETRFAKIQKRIEAQFNYLKRYFSRRILVRAMASAGLILSMGQLQAQTPNFAPGIDNPFNLAPVGYYSKPIFADLDDDNDLDIISGDADGVIHYYENTGIAMVPNFAPPVAGAFGLATLATGNGFAFLTAGDIDGDGDLDIMRGDTEYGDLWLYQNTGTSTAPGFAAAVANPFGLTSLDEYTVPNFADLDNDGDLDLLVTDGYGNLHYFQNTGTATVPAFAAPTLNPFGWVSPNQFQIGRAADLDQDGDIDVMSSSYGGWSFFENTGTPSAPSFSVTANPFGLQVDSTVTGPAIGDIDGDGDLDILAGKYTSTSTSNFRYFENNPLVGTAEELIETHGWAVYPNPSHDELNLKMSMESGSGIFHLAVYGLQGQKVLSQDLETGYGDKMVDISGLVPGSYVAEITGEKGIARLRFVKH